MNFQIIVLIVISCFVSLSECCNCPKSNSSQRDYSGWSALANLANYDAQLIKDYCRADFCLEASVKSEKSFIEDENTGKVTNAFYSFKSVRYFRYKPSSLEAIESGLFLTPLDSCGVDFRSKGIYYLCGSALGPNAWVSSCDYNKKFESLSFSERIFFLGGYKKVNCQDRMEVVPTVTTPSPIVNDTTRKPILNKEDTHLEQPFIPDFSFPQPLDQLDQFQLNIDDEEFHKQKPEFHKPRPEPEMSQTQRQKPAKSTRPPIEDEFEYEYELDQIEMTTRRSKIDYMRPMRPNYPKPIYGQKSN